MKYLYKEFQKIYFKLDKILTLFFSLFIFMEILWIPFNSWASEEILALSGHAYLSSSNIIRVFVEKWWGTALFLLLFLANILIAYLQMALIFISIRQLLDKKVKRFRDYLIDIKEGMTVVMKSTNLSKIVFVLFFSVVLFPFLKRILNIYYYNKLLIPQFILDYLSQNSMLLAILTSSSVIIFFWIASRLMYALPQIFFEQKSVAQALRFSLEKTKGAKQWKYFFQLLWVLLQSFLSYAVLSGFFLGLQILADNLPQVFALPIAIINFTFIQLAYYSAIAVFMIKFVGLLTGEHLPSYHRQRLHHGLRLTIMTLSALVFITQGILYLYSPFTTVPVTISHRGVNNENGVQNSLEALQETAKLKPNYVEMDIQETKDGNFVVMHDTEIANLTGNPGGTHDYNLKELTQMTASENGMSAPVVSFSDYLDKADELGQKLLVEIKVTAQDSASLTHNFLQRYGKRLLAKGHQIQSLDYKTIVEVKQYDKQLVSFFILPFNSIYPTTMADGYTMEYSSLDQNFLVRSWFNQKSVYAWTTNDKDSMMKMMLLNVDGMITDNLTELNSLLTDVKENLDYSYILSLYVQQQLDIF